MKNETKKKKEKKTITSDVLTMLLIVGGIILVLVGFVAYNFGHSAGAADKAKKAEDAVNEELIQMAEDQQKMEEKYKDVYDLVVSPSEAHESEAQYDLSVYKKEYPLINYGALYNYGELANWQVIYRSANGDSYVCVDTDILNQYCDQLYTYVTPYIGEEEPTNLVSVLENGEIIMTIPCERLYFTSQELKDSFRSAGAADEDAQSAE